MLPCFVIFFFFVSIAFVQEEGSTFGSFLRMGCYSHLSFETLEGTWKIFSMIEWLIFLQKVFRNTFWR